MVVTAVIAAPDGHMVSVDVLEAPDSSIARAVQNTLAAWRVTPVATAAAPQGRSVKSKLTFYYRLTGSEAKVLSPEEAASVAQRMP